MFLRTVFFATVLSVQQIQAQGIQLEQPPVAPALFAEGIVSTGLNERDFALSPARDEIFYTLQSPVNAFQTILYMKKDRNGNWSSPEIAPFAGKFSDIEPAFSPDGRRLFFSSNRMPDGTGTKDYDIWVVSKTDNGWSEPVNIGAPVNTAADEFYPAVAKSGNLYFTAAYKNAVGKEDIWMAKWENDKYAEVVSLDTAVNSKTYEFNAFVSPDEDLIIFTSYGRKDDKGRGDLYMSVKDASGKWLPAKNLSFLNSDRLDYCPFVSFDKKSFFFTSERHQLRNTYLAAAIRKEELSRSFSGPQNGFGDIYWIRFEKLMEVFNNN